VVASGRPFDFQCPGCGHRQKVRPSTGLGVVGEPEASGSLPAVLPPRVELPPPVAASTAPAVDVESLPFLAPTGQLGDDDPLDADFDDSYRNATERIDATIVDTPMWSGQPLPVESTLKLRLDGEVFPVEDIATLQRWVMENRVGLEDEVSEREHEWVRAGDIPALAAAFETVARLAAEAEAAAENDDQTDGGHGEYEDATMESPSPPTEEVGRMPTTNDDAEASMSINPLPVPVGPVVPRPPDVRIVAPQPGTGDRGSTSMPWLVGALLFTVTAFGVYRYALGADETQHVVLPIGATAQVAPKPAAPKPTKSIRRSSSPAEASARAWEALRTERAAEAAESMGAALAEWPEDPRLLHALGAAYLALSQRDKGLVTLCRARDNADSRIAIDETLQQAGLNCKDRGGAP
jgi:hypothetical protein